MTIAEYEGQAFAPAATGAPLRLVEWAQEAHAANMLAKALSRTAFAGAYKDDEDGATAAILKGAEVGLTPVTALGAFDLIQGTPCPKAITLRALVQSQGHTVWIESSTDRECVARARRSGEAEVHESRWTIARAEKLGLLTKQQWQKQPQAMLVARATSEVCRLVAADVILGIGYSAEEMLDAEPVETVTVTREPAKRRTAQRAPRPAAIEPPEPSLDPAPEPEPESAVDDAVTPAQIKMLAATMGQAGMTDRADALAYVASVIGREVASRNDLTRAEASRVIDALLHADDDIADAEVVTEGGES